MSDTAAPERGISQSNKRALRNPWVLGWLALVVVVFVVNAGMVLTAMGTFPGLVTEEYYKTGENYHQVIERRQSAAASGWELEIGVPYPLPFGQPAELRLKANDAEGRPVTGATGRLFAYRRANAADDLGRIELTEVEPGVFRGEVDFPLKGWWDLVGEIEKEGVRVDVARRVNVKAE